LCTYNPLDKPLATSGAKSGSAAPRLLSEEFRKQGVSILNFMTQREGLLDIFV